jgi:maltooligosyltrehalose trehalohydrolase
MTAPPVENARTPTEPDGHLNQFRFGPLLGQFGVRFRIWAPLSNGVDVLIKGEAKPRPMQRRGEWFELEVPSAGAGTLYKFAMSDGTRLPDPGSRFQPYDVSEWSEVIDSGTFLWTDGDWAGRPWHETVLYELHIGTFTPQGSYRAATEKLDHLARLGVTAISLMPLADFPGRWNWGYDGTLLYAPDASYGRPDDLRALVDAAHRRGLMVILDVVYNHLGPERKSLAHNTRMASDRHGTEWGPTFNFDEPAVRSYVVENALYWIRDFHMDGLRLDAIHTVADDSRKHVLEELTEAVQRYSHRRHLHLIAENSANQTRWLKRRDSGQPRYFVAQWNDELHHALHAAGTGEFQGASADFAGRPDLLGRALAEGYAYQGEMLPSEGRPQGEASAFLPPTAFVSFLQNHDQIGNRPLGDRIATLAPKPALRALAAIYLVAPQVPMLFMGEEWGSRRPFLFFSDREPPSGTALPRRSEWQNAPPVDDWNTVPDPYAEQSFLDSRLDWAEPEAPEHREWLDFYTALLELRRREIVPRLQDIGGHSGTYRVFGGHAVEVRWQLAEGSELLLLANLQDAPLEACQPWRGRSLWLEGSAGSTTLHPWSLVWNLIEPARPEQSPLKQ